MQIVWPCVIICLNCLRFYRFSVLACTATKLLQNKKEYPYLSSLDPLRFEFELMSESVNTRTVLDLPHIAYVLILQ